ncbi:geranylgeranyl transferase, putative [Phytophthora infestans T30-4]|uniref:Geranylgeranyl transferase type-1 subunit beta n=2 Tax=Phytophthora infestans TaxID=4787 RepID=D0NZY1_PHYIT|nr:geranylgeranyl transferase type-1 subunit beta, putative [Phytophthora infestans T30-4]XP_002997072.1 geranylgeranyl transferase, putative [Phytophthora infestans T30-4]KAF4028178.1 Prenyltransferase and squalene oxidase repeat [Phytophthora infestans]EEY59744.1 geranylgeranyl transferase type-1 subunit beta, putative [Phytophthora infestans T30-4]EEY70138.1 geranylgeranyl transferase, putative [Phytophthora infestans T30-4]KAF4028220.1 Prenyltransferase and squalene oxidase repeat [Phytoph|eukprot:XP_002909863.1 geranylgeranyl transferase type-1 subunit beta, putative [Phytophthora infestans T30-4]
MATTFDRELHTRYFLKNLRSLPEPYASQDSQRVVLAFFCIHGLALLEELELVDKCQIIEWVYSLQVSPDCRDVSLNADDCGFRGGTFMGNTFGCPPSQFQSEVYDSSNIASTFAALCILRTLGDDLSRVNKAAIIGSLKHLQNKTTGCFSSANAGSEEDMRFVYCACAISYILEDWSGVDRVAMVRFINSCLNYDGGIGLSTGAESHGGAVFVAIASLFLSGRVMQLKCEQSDLVRWLVFRQQGGFQGRCNKSPDSCYAFWNGATLDLLGKHSFVDIPSCKKFIYSCQFPFGGLCKYPDTVPDVMHSYLSLAWLSIAVNSNTIVVDGEELPKLAPLDTKLQVPFFPKLHGTTKK